MPYSYTNIDLETIDASGANLRPVKNYIPGPVPSRVDVSMGELLRLSIQIDKSSPGSPRFQSGQFFGFNIKLFADQIHDFIPRTGQGWKIELKQNPLTGLTASWSLQTSGREFIDQNININSVTFSAGNTRMTIVFDFYVTSDVTNWLGLNNIAEQLNLNRWTRSSRAAQDEDDLLNSQASAFKRLQSWIEFAVWESDAGLIPLTTQGPTPQNPIVRDPLAPEFETYAIECGVKWYDQNVGATNIWNTTTAKDDNWLKQVTVTAGNLGIITQVDHKGYPFESESVLANFDFDVGDTTTQLVINQKGATTAEKNNVQIVIGSPNLADYTNVEVHLIRVDAGNELFPFTKTYQLVSANIPKLNPGAGIINGPFETPSVWAVAGGDLTIDFVLNGERLQQNATYHMIVVLTKDDGGDDFSSTHITPPLTTSLANINVPTVTGFIETYNNVYGPTINDLSVSNFERVKIGILVDSTTYGPNFVNELSQVRLRSILLGQNAVVSGSKFPSGPSTGSPQIEIVDLGGGIYEISATLRSYYAVVGTNQSFHTWELEFTPQGFNQPDVWVGKFEQILRHRPNDLTRLPNIRILDASVFPGSLVEKFFICENIDEQVVIEVEKNGLPNANLIAMLLQSPPVQSDPTNLPAIEEAENYAGNLPQLTSLSIPQVDAQFATQLDPDKAYFTVNVADLTSQKVFHATAINI